MVVDSKLKGDDDTSEQDHNFDSDFVYDEVDSNTEVIKGTEYYKIF